MLIDEDRLFYIQINVYILLHFHEQLFSDYFNLCCLFFYYTFYFVLFCPVSGSAADSSLFQTVNVSWKYLIESNTDEKKNKL